MTICLIDRLPVGQRSRWRVPMSSSRGSREQRPQSDQVVGRGGEGHLPIDELASTMPQLSQPADRLHPAEDLFDEFPTLLTGRVALVPRRPAVDRTVFV